MMDYCDFLWLDARIWILVLLCGAAFLALMWLLEWQRREQEEFLHTINNRSRRLSLACAGLAANRAKGDLADAVLVAGKSFFTRCTECNRIKEARAQCKHCGASALEESELNISQRYGSQVDHGGHTGAPNQD